MTGSSSFFQTDGFLVSLFVRPFLPIPRVTFTNRLSAGGREPSAGLLADYDCTSKLFVSSLPLFRATLDI